MQLQLVLAFRLPHCCRLIELRGLMERHGASSKIGQRLFPNLEMQVCSTVALAMDSLLVVLVDTLNANLSGMHPLGVFRPSHSAKSMRKTLLQFFFSNWHKSRCSTSTTLLPRNHCNPIAQQYFCFQFSSISNCFPHIWIREI